MLRKLCGDHIASKIDVSYAFAVLNVDDYYGVDAFKTMYDAITALLVLVKPA